MPVRPDKGLKSFQHIFTKTWLCSKCVAMQQVILSALLLPPTLTHLLHAEILGFPKETQEEWKAACHEELEALCRQNVLEVTDLPKGHKIIKNCWVFDIKSDG